MYAGTAWYPGNTFCHNIIRRVGDGKLIKFWNDAWIRSCGRLVDVAASNTPHYELQKSVAEYIDVNGCWQIDTIKDYGTQQTKRGDVSLLINGFVLSLSHSLEFFLSADVSC